MLVRLYLLVLIPGTLLGMHMSKNTSHKPTQKHPTLKQNTSQYDAEESYYQQGNEHLDSEEAYYQQDDHREEAYSKELDAEESYSTYSRFESDNEAYDSFAHEEAYDHDNQAMQKNHRQDSGRQEATSSSQQAKSETNWLQYAPAGAGGAVEARDRFGNTYIYDESQVIDPSKIPHAQFNPSNFVRPIGQFVQRQEPVYGKSGYPLVPPPSAPIEQHRPPIQYRPDGGLYSTSAK